MPDKTDTVTDAPKDSGDSAFEGFSTVDGEIREPDGKDGGEGAKSDDASKGNVAGNKPGESPAGSTESDDTPTEPSEGEEEGGNDEPRPKRSAQERINKAVGRQRAAERRADTLEGKLDALQAQVAALVSGKAVDPATEVDPNAPNPGSYEFGELDPRFVADLARYEARKEFTAQQEKTAKERETREQATAREEAERKISEFSGKWEKKYPDFDETVIQTASNEEWPLSPVVGMLALESDVGGDIVYSLAKDIKLAQHVANMPEARQAAWFGRQEAKYSSSSQDDGSGGEESPRSLTVTQAPAPLNHKAKGAQSSTVSPDSTDFAAFEALVTANNK